MAKEWDNKDKYHPSNGVLEPHVQMPRAKASVRTVPAWGERKAAGGVAGRATPVRPVRHTGQTSAGLGRQRWLVFVPVMSLGLVQEVVVLVVGLESLQVVSLLGVFPSCSIRDGRSRSIELERRKGPWSSFRGFGFPPVREGWFPQCGYHGNVH
jgi:hypothetical protein